MEQQITPIAKRHAPAVATLHCENISTGFLSSLGKGFLKQVYSALPSCSAGFGYVCEQPDGRVLGFVACSESTGRVYKQSMIRRGLPMALAILPRFLRHPCIIKRIWETLRYPGSVADDLPRAEVLSIAVDDSARGQGVGKALLQRAFEEFSRRGLRRVKVAVGGDNEGANAFYQRCGFHLAVTRQHHGLPMNIYVADLGD